MHENYGDIFTQRGKQYHYAMTQYPKARQLEFLAGLEFFDFSTIENLVDVPSGPGYLSKYLKEVSSVTHYIPLDPSQTFSACGEEILLFENFGELPIETGSVDASLSLAGLHHESKRVRFYEEVFRILKPKSKFVIGEVIPESSEALFLNEFVDQHSSLGHKGDFLDKAQEVSFLKQVGFKHVDYKVKEYSWDFSNEKQALDFFVNLFGIDKVEDHALSEAVRTILGINEGTGFYNVNWKLAFFIATK